MFDTRPRQVQSGDAQKALPAGAKDVAPTPAKFVPTAESAAKMANDLIMSWVANGGEPRVPAGRREETVATLNAAMVDVKIFDAYDGALRAGWDQYRKGPPMAGHRHSDTLPEKEIYASGFSTLDDRTLGEMAVSPASVYAMYMSITFRADFPDQPAPMGQWFSAEITAYKERSGHEPSRTTPAREEEFERLLRSRKLI